MSESNKRSRSLRPRNKLKKPEFYSTETPETSTSERGESSSSSSPKKKKPKPSPKKEELPPPPPPATPEVSASPKSSRKRPSSKSNRQKKRRRPSANTLGGCTSLGTGRRSSNRDRSQQRMEDSNQSNDQQGQVNLPRDINSIR